ncbi:c-type cytochrome [Catalinimonas niigatensis]|uniref:c-type cytochrome n=1 Tax=Catalinimonas niigatensis TaxID=1397264 RepID=UPI00266712CF|nr:cytochrome c [Catalinimonas niigatensis]WPP52310.1 cytochrome c [Catalinimonas niigatensis]
MNNLFSYLLFFLLIFFGCDRERQNENASIQNLSVQEKMRFNQYMVYGQTLYTQHCSNCHQEEGTGLRRVIPPLAKSDYMLEDIKRTVCLIRYGLEDTIKVNGQAYHQKMPANEKLTALEIAQITTYITNTWGNDKGYISVKETTEHLESCK